MSRTSNEPLGDSPQATPEAQRPRLARPTVPWRELGVRKLRELGLRWRARDRIRMVRLPAVAFATVAVGACASVPPAPTAEMTRAETAIEQAQTAGAAEFANESLSAAQRGLAEAKSAAARRDAARASQLVEEARADARLADLKAQSAKAARAAAEVDTSIRTLEAEAGRAFATRQSNSEVPK